MAYRTIALSALQVNRANDRHGELENETAAIAWLFNARETHMRNLTRDIVERQGIYEPPLVAPDGKKFVVFDGNRRVTCLKLLSDPKRAPTTELRDFFTTQRASWDGDFPTEIECQVEVDRDRIDEILYRRHTGTQNGVGQSTWDDRMKQTFVSRTGKHTGVNVADEIERRLAEANQLPGRKKIPRSTLNRLLSAEPFRNRLGFTISKGKFEFTHDEEVSLAALSRVANDLASKDIVLNDVWDVDGKRSYLDALEREKVLPTAVHAVSKKAATSVSATKVRPTSPIRPKGRTTLIPQSDFSISWPGRLQRSHAIWEELQFGLTLADHPNAISVLFRVLLELAIENYIAQEGVAVQPNDKLQNRALKVATDMRAKGKIDDKGLGIIKKFGQTDQLVSADTLNRYVHSNQFAPSPEHLTAMWDNRCTSFDSSAAPLRASKRARASPRRLARWRAYRCRFKSSEGRSMV